MAHFDSEYLTITHAPESDAVVMQWKARASGEDFRGGLDRGLALLKEKRTSRWLANMRDLGIVTQEDKEWVNTNWFPRAIEGGMRFMALVVPKSALSKMSVKHIMNEVDGADIVTHYFDDVDDAHVWLSSSSPKAQAS